MNHADSSPDDSSHPFEEPEERHEQAPSYTPAGGDYDGISSAGFESVEDLHAARDLAEMIVDTVREALLILDLDLRVRAANESFYQVFEVSPEETVGHRIYESGNGQWDIAELHELLEDILPENKMFNDLEIDHDFEQIGRRVMLLNARQLDDHEMILLAIEDVTERQVREEKLAQSHERFDLLVQNAKEYAIFVMNPDTRITTWNPGAERILGWSEEEVLGRKGEIIFTPEDREAGRDKQELVEARANGTALDEHWHVRKDGSRFWASGFMVALHRDGELRGWAKVLRDNTQSKQAEEERKELLAALERERAELRELNETLEERVEERTRQVRQLASTLTMAEQEERRRISQVLHDDLQQQLYGIQLKMSFVRREVKAKRQQEALGHLDEAEAWISQGVDITRNLTVDLSPPILQSEGLSAALEWLQRPMQELHGLRVEIKAEKAFRTPEEDMRVLLFQIVRELLFNVVKHAEADRATVELRDVDDHIAIVVADEGKGFDVEAVEAQMAETGGFGLFSIRERLGLFGGRMQIESAPGKGTRVTVNVPLQVE